MKGRKGLGRYKTNDFLAYLNGTVPIIINTICPIL
jgi:hypothetical protein